MKQIEFKTSKGEFLVIEFPQVLKELSISRAGMQVPQKDGSHLFISGNFTPLGYIPDITEEQAKEVVSSLVKNEQGAKSYVYTLIQLLKTKGVVFDNPLGNEPKKLVFLGSQMVTTIEWDKWIDTQSKVRNKNNTYLFKKI